MSGCILSPYGTYDTSELCYNDSQCGYKYACSATGVPEKRADGTFDTAEECKCWNCTVSGCEINPDGTGGYGSEADCNSACVSGYTCTNAGPVLEVNGAHASPDECKYVCDGQGGVRVRVDGDVNEGVVYADATNCWSCTSSQNAQATTSGDLGHVASSDVTCTYTCLDGERVYSPDTDVTTANSLSCYSCDPNNATPHDPVPISGTGGNHRTGSLDSCAYQCNGSGGVEYAGDLYLDEGNRIEDLICYDCTGDHAYTPVERGTMGTYSGDDDLQCRYWCDEAGNTIAVTDAEKAEATFDVNNTKTTGGEVKCTVCSGEAGPESSCVHVERGTLGTFSSLEECDLDDSAQCGHGYGCSGDECVISATAQRGRTHTQCKLDSDVQCGWGYGCFDKFACLDGLSCAAVPEDQCTSLECHDSMEACTAGSTCTNAIRECLASPLEGNWMIHRHETFVSITNSPDPADEVFTFTPDAQLDTEGYQWYSSNIVDTEGLPIIEVGLMETVTDIGSASLTRNIWMKFKGRVSWTSGSGVFYPFYSGKASDGFGYTNPEAYIIAQLPSGSDECFVFDSIDLNQICGDNCHLEIDVNGVMKGTSLLLQREELCPWRAVGSGDPANYGRLTDAACVDNPCQFLSDPITVYFSMDTDNSVCGPSQFIQDCTPLTRSNITFTVEAYNPSYGEGYKLTNGDTVIEIVNFKEGGVLTGEVQIDMKHGTVSAFSGRQAIKSFANTNVDRTYATICGTSNQYVFDNGSSITFSTN